MTGEVRHSQLQQPLLASSKAQGEPSLCPPIIRYRPTPSGPADTRTGATRGEVSYAPVWEGD